MTLSNILAVKKIYELALQYLYIKLYIIQYKTKFDLLHQK